MVKSIHIFYLSRLSNKLKVDLHNHRLFVSRTFISKSKVTNVDNYFIKLVTKLELQSSRNYSSAGTVNEKLERYKVTERLVLHKALSRDGFCWPLDPTKVLVLFFPWLGAKEKHIEKYRQLYSELGLDVLTIKSKNSDFLWPPNSMKLAQHLDETLSRSLTGYEHYICHSMSAGAYNQTVLGMYSRSKDQGALLRKIKGIVFDSIVVGGGAAGVIKTDESSPGSGSNALDKMVKGVATSISSNEHIHGLVALLSKLYFGVTKKYTLDFYEKSVAAVRDEPVPVPTLLIGSKDDPLSDHHITEQVVEVWRQRNTFPITLHLFEHSPHAQHYILHKEEYTNIHKKFLDDLFLTRFKPIKSNL